MIRPRHKRIAKEFGEATFKTNFTDFQNPALRGVNFYWSNFPNMTIGSAETQLFMYFRDSVWKRFTKQDILDLKDILSQAILDKWAETDKTKLK